MGACDEEHQVTSFRRACGAWCGGRICQTGDAGAETSPRPEASLELEGARRTIGVPCGSNPVTCPVRAWCGWLELSGITEGPALRLVDRHGHIGTTRLSGQAVALVLKRHAACVGLDPAEVAGHSLRAGLATSAAAAGVPERVIANQIGHKGTAMLRRYIREGSLFRENAASAVGL